MKSIYKDILFVSAEWREWKVSIYQTNYKKIIITRCAVNFRETVYSDVNMWPKERESQCESGIEWTRWRKSEREAERKRNKILSTIRFQIFWFFDFFSGLEFKITCKFIIK